MGIREIQKKIKLKEAMAKKAAELKAQELEAKARIKDFTAQRIREIAEEHGFILAINDEIQGEIEALKEKYGIPESRIIRRIVKKEEILNHKNKVDHEALGWFIFQEVLIKKEETGGIFTVPELFVFLEPFELSDQISIKDIEKAMERMEKINAIAGFEKLKSGVQVVYFFDEKFTSDYKIVLNIARKQGFVMLDDLLELGWSPQRVESVLESLTHSGIARYDESYLKGKRWYFPGV
ncbi:hypothetical protein GF325_07520 [Candidatus Bathyarchaeota archaeon]|nr:hypothetical protein [Candidatus Bathyarchaeota archaeon]